MLMILIVKKIINKHNYKKYKRNFMPTKNSIKISFALITIISVIATYQWLGQTKPPVNSLVVGTCSGFPPYELMDQSGNIVGLDIDVARALAQALGKKLEIRDMSFDALIIALQQGKIDCAIAGISITKSRQQEIALIHYSGKPLSALPLVFWEEIPKNIYKLNDLKFHPNKTVCAQAGTIQHEIISTYDWLDIKCLENIADLIMDIKYGKSIATVLEPKVVYALQKKYSQLKTLDIPLTPEQQDFGFGIGVNKNNRELIKKISAVIETLKTNGTIEQFETKWINGEIAHDIQ